MSWRIDDCDRELQDYEYIAIPGSENGLLQVVNYYGKKDALIRAGVVTEKMLRLDPVDNGVGITEDEFGNHMCFIENHSGPGVYFITKYLESDGRKSDEDDFRGRSIDQVDVSGILKRIEGVSS